MGISHKLDYAAERRFLPVPVDTISTLAKSIRARAEGRI